MESTTYFLLYYLCIQDIESNFIQDRFFCLLYIDLLIYNNPRIDFVLLAILFFCLLWCGYMKGMLGGADLKYLLYVYLLVGLSCMLVVVLCGSLIGLLYSLSMHKKRIPFLPFLVIGTLVVYYLW